MEVGDYIQALNAAKSLTPDWREGDMNEAQLATERARPALIQAQTHQMQFETQKAVDEQQRAQDQRARFGKRLADLGTNPSPTALYKMAVDFPDFAPPILKAADGMSAEAKVAMVKTAAPLFALIQRGQFDKARDSVDRLIKADEASGVATDEHTLELRDILHGDDVAQKKAAGGMLYGMIASAHPDTAAKTIADFETARTRGQVVGKGIGHYDETGKWVLDYQAPEYHTLGPQQRLYETTGGEQGGPAFVAEGAPVGQAGEGAASRGVRRQNGWTPSERDGGDNPHPIVEAKIGAIGQQLSFDPDKPLSKTQLGPLAEAIASTEGGKGSLADRNNNPTNIRNGSFAKSQSGYAGPGEGGYARFKSPAAGLLAAKGLLSRYYARGQRTIRDIIAGKPVGGGATPSQAGARLVAEGGPAPSYQMLSPAQASARGLDPSRSYQVAPNGRVTPVSGAGGGSGTASGQPRTVTSVVAPILQKVAAGQPLTAGETEALRYYRANGRKGGSAPATGGGGKPPPKVGTVMDGHRFIGGDPGKASSWVAVK